MKRIRLEPRNGVIKNNKIEVETVSIPLNDNPKIDWSLSSIDKNRKPDLESFLQWRMFMSGVILNNDLFLRIQKRF